MLQREWNIWFSFLHKVLYKHDANLLYMLLLEIAFFQLIALEIFETISNIFHTADLLLLQTGVSPSCENNSDHSHKGPTG